jgi:hypothetical protein
MTSGGLCCLPVLLPCHVKEPQRVICRVSAPLHRVHRHLRTTCSAPAVVVVVVMMPRCVRSKIFNLGVALSSLV